ncbi:MAG: PTS sugar transporter subunit IIA [Bacilli bacterium]
MLKAIVEQNLYCFEEGFETWQESVRASYKPLLNANIIEDEYIEAVVSCIEKYGPYIIITPHVAMPHSTEGAKGVNKTSVSFMKVKHPVSFDKEDSEKDATLFFSLASIDHEQHLKNIMELSEMLMNDAIVEALLKVENKKDLEVIVQKYNL